MINLFVILFTLAGIHSILLTKNGLENSLQLIIFFQTFLKLAFICGAGNYNYVVNYAAVFIPLL